MNLDAVINNRVLFRPILGAGIGISIGLFLVALTIDLLLAPNLEERLRYWKHRFACLVQSGLVGRLLVYTMILVVPLIFYVYVREHYWTTKFAAFQFLFLTGLAWTWSSWGRPKHRFPLAWPAVLFVLWASLALLVCVNTAEANRFYLWTCFAPWLAWFAYQHIDTIKRMHLAMVLMAMMAAVVYFYGIKQTYMLFYPILEFASTQEPVSTAGNVNFAAYIIDLTIPLLICLAAMKRKRWWLALSVLYIFLAYMGRVHLALCATRASRLTFTLTLPMMLFLVWWYVPYRARILLLAIGFELVFKATLPGLDLTRSGVWQTRPQYDHAQRTYVSRMRAFQNDQTEERRQLALDAYKEYEVQKAVLSRQVKRVVWLAFCFLILSVLGVAMLYWLDTTPGWYICLGGIIAYPLILIFAGMANGATIGRFFWPPEGRTLVSWWLSEPYRWLIVGTLWLLGVAAYQGLWLFWSRFAKKQHDWHLLQRRYSQTIWGVGISAVIIFALVFIYKEVPLRRLMEEVGTVEGVGWGMLYPFQQHLINILADGPTLFRLEVWREGCEIIKDNPLFGLGPGNFKIAEPLYETVLERRVLGREVLGRNPHNDYIYYGVEYGFGGLLAVVWAMIVVGFVLVSALTWARPAKYQQEEFLNCFMWGVLWALVHLALRANFEMPLYQPSSTVLFSIYIAFALQCYQIVRAQNKAYSSPPETPVPMWSFGVEPKHFRKGVYACVFNDAGPYSDPPPVVQASEAFNTVEKRKSKKDKSGSAGASPSIKNLATNTDEPEAETAPEGRKLWVASVRWSLFFGMLILLYGNLFCRQFLGESLTKWMMNLREFDSGRFGLVHEAFERATAVYPQEMETYYIYGRYCIDAVTEIDRLTAETDNPAQEERNQAELAKKQLNPDDRSLWIERGIIAYIRDLKMNPNYKWAHNNLGVLYDKGRDVLKAREYYLRALHVDDRQVYALFNIAMGYLREGTNAMARGEDEKALSDFQYAIPFFERTVRVEPERTDVFNYIEFCKLQIDRMERHAAEAKLSDVTEELDSPQELADRIQKLLMDRDWTTAEQLISLAEHRHPQLVAFKIQRAVAAAGQNNLDEAERILQQMIDIAGDKTPASVHFYMARFAALRPNQEKAIAHIRKCLQIDQDGYLERIKKDGILKTLSGLPAFKAAIEETQTAQPE